MIILENLKETECPRCKGYGYMRGQWLRNGRQMVNYKHISHGICFACEGKKVLHKTEEGAFIKIDNGKIVEYDHNGKYIGVIENTRIRRYKTEEEIDKLEREIKLNLVKALCGTSNISDIDKAINELEKERNNYYKFLYESGDKNKTKSYLKIVIKHLELNNKFIDRLKTKDNEIIKNFTSQYEYRNNDNIKIYKNRLFWLG